jgi:hypothetical protein
MISYETPGRRQEDSERTLGKQTITISRHLWRYSRYINMLNNGCTYVIQMVEPYIYDTAAPSHRVTNPQDWVGPHIMPPFA